MEKVKLLAESETALKSLKVCWHSQSDENCQACNKCYRTMTTLLLLGALDLCSTFSVSNLDIDRTPRIYSMDENDRVLLGEVRDLALEKGRRDIAKAIERSFRCSKRLDLYMGIINRFKEKPLVWRRERFLLGRSLI